MTSNQAKHTMSNKKNILDWINLLLVLFAIIVISIIISSVMPKSTLANPYKFCLADKYECNIERDDVFFDPVAELDVLRVEMIIENKDAQNVNSEFLKNYRVYAIQGKDQLDEFSNQRDDFFESNFQNLDVKLNSNEKMRVSLYYYLLNDEEVSLLFFNNDQEIVQTIQIPIMERKSFQTWLVAEAEKAEVSKKQNLKTAELNCIKVYFTDDWYADSQASVNIKIKNSKNNATIDVEYDSTMNAENLIKQHAGWLNYTGQISQMDINDHEFYLIQPSDNSFVLTANASNGYSIKISGSNTNLDEAWHLIESLEIL